MQSGAKSMKYYLGLDNGGTTTKAAIFDEDGKQIATAGMSTQMLVPKPGFTERDMEEMWEANCHVVKEALRLSGCDPHDIAAVAVCGHGKGLYLWGKNEAPVRNGIISTDNRAWEYPKQWAKAGVTERVFAYSCQNILPSQPVSLLAWLRDNEPNVIEQTKYIFECKDYVRFRLTGEAYAERTDYSGANFVNLTTGEYDPELLALFGLSECFDKLPPLRNATDICGYITKEAAQKTGLMEGTPVAGGAFDIDACAIAVNVTDETHICMIAGTWSINEYIRKAPVLDGSVLMNSFFCLPGYYLVEECSATSAGNNEWFIKTMLPEAKQIAKAEGKRFYDLMDEWADAIETSVLCPIFLPFLMASNVHPNAMACFVGMSNYHTRAHIVRSIYEGIAFSHRYHLEKLLQSRTEPPLGIRLAGGVANSAVWTQMFADIMNLPMETVRVKETGALGCAIIGATASGAYASLQEAAQKMCKLSNPVIPDQERAAIYDRKYQIYKATIDALDPLWDDIQAYKDGRI